MTDPLQILERARTHLIAGETDLAFEKMKFFEALALSGRLGKEAAAESARMLGDIQLMAGAICDGIGSARRQLAEIAAMSRGLDFYDRHGKKIVNPVARPKEHRF